MSRRHFGTIRQLPSGKVQASYRGPDRQRHYAPATFPNPREAQRWLDRVESDIRKGFWVSHDYRKRTLREYCEAYLDENPRVGPRWAETCRRNMRLHLSPLLDVPIVNITPPVVRSWHAKALRGKGGRTSISQSYRFLRSVMSVAVEDDSIPRNPCQVPGAGGDRAKERRIATADQVAELIDSITPRYRAAVVLAAWCGLRRGEVCALRRGDVDLVKGIVTVRKNWASSWNLRRNGRKIRSAAGAGANVADLKKRLGHSTTVPRCVTCTRSMVVTRSWQKHYRRSLANNPRLQIRVHATADDARLDARLARSSL